MRRPAGYVQRVANLSRTIEILSHHPDGLPLAQVAAQLGVRAEQLRETVLTYYRLDLVEYGFDDLRQPVIEFVHGEGHRDDDPGSTEILRLVSARAEAELGMEHLSSSQLAALYQAAANRLELEPGDEDLRSALEAVRASLLPIDAWRDGPEDSATVRALHTAATARRRVRIHYAGTWRPGIRERVIEPYRLLRTRRGWEVDAGVVSRPGAVRTFLVSGMIRHEVLAETFEPPPDVDDRLTRNRATSTVELVVPQTARWVVHRFAERVEVVAEDEESVKVRAHLLPPLDRLGLVLITAGPSAFALGSTEERTAGERLARRLLAHHTMGDRG